MDLHVDWSFWAFFWVDLDLKAALLDGLDKAVVGGIECGVLGELQNADGVVGTGGSRAGTRVAAASGERGEREPGRRRPEGSCG